MALITFILLAVRPELQVQLLVWIFAMRLIMVVASGVSYWINESLARKRYLQASEMDFEKPLTSLIYITSLVSIATTYLGSLALIHISAAVYGGNYPRSSRAARWPGH